METYPSKFTAEVEITVEIKKEDLEALNAALKDFTPDQIFLIVSPNSQGGNLKVAMSIGRVLRKYNALALMLEDQICHSACVFIIAGTPERVINGKVGIHRPYFYQDNQTTVAGQQKQKSNLDNLALKYLRDMNISDTLYYDMVRISPQDIKILSKDDLLRYGLGSDDPYFEDAKNAKKAKSLRIPTSELMNRKSTAKTICSGDVKERIKCFEEIVEKGNLEYQPEKRIDKAVSTNKNELIATLDKLRPNWKEITSSVSFKDWKMSLSKNERTILDDSWDPYLLNDKIQQYLDQKDSGGSNNFPIRLSCVVNKNDLILKVNFERSTVNGTNAQINDSYIKYAPDGLEITINRASGGIRVDYVPPYSKKGIPLLPDYGQCKRVEANNF